MKSERKKEITTDELAQMVAKGFDNTATKAEIEEINGSLARIENNLIYHIGSINRRIDDYALNKVSYDKFDPLVKRVYKLEKAK